MLLSNFAAAEVLEPVKHSALLQKAVETINSDYLQSWAFTETKVKPTTTTVGRYNPGRADGERWTLISINERTPTESETIEYLEEKSQASEGDDGDAENDDNEGIGAMVEPGSLSLIEETDEYWLFNFVPSADEDGEAFSKAVVGTLRILKNGHYLAAINMHSTKPFKPQFGIKIKQFMTRLQFGPASEAGPIVPISVDFAVEARAFLVKTISENTSISFTDYRYVGDL